ncbi:MAG: hypothetical protein D3906_13975 [Candidatus Electrothrix sp. AUS1_2]|nr:hypothetical protein [Candidatus Electrothrix sp. AUS1_2]
MNAHSGIVNRLLWMQRLISSQQRIAFFRKQPTVLMFRSGNFSGR